MKTLLKPQVDTEEIIHPSGIDGKLSWVEENKAVLCQTVLQVLIGRHTYDYAQCLCLWDFPAVIICKITFKNAFNSRFKVSYSISNLVQLSIKEAVQYLQLSFFVYRMFLFLYLASLSECSYHSLTSRAGVKRKMKRSAVQSLH